MIEKIEADTELANRIMKDSGLSWAQSLDYSKRLMLREAIQQADINRDLRVILNSLVDMLPPKR